MNTWMQRKYAYTDPIMVSIVIPAKNEVRTIGWLLKEIRAVTTTMNNHAEIIVIDDGSTDGTSAIAHKMNAITHRNKWSLGKGYALRQGFALARGDIIITMDADGSHFPQDIPALVKPLMTNEADMVIGVRNNMADITLTHSIGNYFLNFFISAIMGYRFEDTQSGFRSIKRAVLQTLALRASRFDIESEMLIKALKQGFRVVEEPVNYSPRSHGRTRIQPLPDGFRIMMRILSSLLTR
jgi:glycosyltransferase involved in cell wall biosynthesis